MLRAVGGLVVRSVAQVHLKARPILSSRVAARSVHVLASFRNSWRSKALISVWIAVAVWVWVFLARKDVNLVFSVALRPPANGSL